MESQKIINLLDHNPLDLKQESGILLKITIMEIIL